MTKKPNWRPVFALFGLALGAAPAVAVSTTTTALSSAAYVSLGTGPMMLGVSGCGLSWQISDFQPAPGSPGFGLRPGQRPVAIATVSQVWAVGEPCAAPVLAITAPVNSAAGGGAAGDVAELDRGPA